jgi:hypothetical protein
MSTTTFNALLARDIDSAKANQLISAGHNLTSLKKLKDDELKKLGLSGTTIEILQKESRPPIPTDTVIDLLYKARQTCCVCRDNTKSVIIHHINEWHESKDHSEDNLVVLCLNHHDEAHSKKTLSLNLSNAKLISYKAKWEKDVQTLDAKAILGLMNNYSRWDNINIKRVFELFIEMKIQYDDIETYLNLVQLNIIDERGLPKAMEHWSVQAKPQYYMCDFDYGFQYTHYLKTIVSRIVNKLNLIDLTNNLSTSFIKLVVKPGTIITAQLGYYFKDIDPYKELRQLRKGYYKGNGIRIEYTFDAWECTSNSARYDALTNRKMAVPILFVRSVLEEEDGTLVINGSCLAIGTWFDNHRQYSEHT